MTTTPSRLSSLINAPVFDLAAVQAESARRRALADAALARATAKADALNAQAEATWSAYIAAMYPDAAVRDFNLGRRLAAQYQAERHAANVARGHARAAYVRRNDPRINAA